MYKAFGSLLMEKSRNSDVMFLPCLFHGPVLGLLHGDKPLVLNCSVVRERGFVLPCYKGLTRFLILFQIGKLIWTWHIQSVLKTWRVSAKS